MRTEALAETQADGIEGVAQRLDRSAGLGGDVPDTSTVQMHLQVIRVCIVGYPYNLILGEDGTVERVFERDDLRRCVVDVVVKNNVRLDILERQVMT